MRRYVRFIGAFALILPGGIEKAATALRRGRFLQLSGATAHDTLQVRALTAVAW
jgi:hypothetical protein